MATYTTKQRKVILDFLKSRSHQIFSAQQIIAALSDEKISNSAVYRNLADLEASGEVKKVSKSGNRTSMYQYFDSDACRNQIHLFCDECENSYHMNISNVQLLGQELLNNDQFQLNQGNTVIHGICKDCKHKPKV